MEVLVSQVEEMKLKVQMELQLLGMTPQVEEGQKVWRLALQQVV